MPLQDIFTNSLYLALVMVMQAKHYNKELKKTLILQQSHSNV